jgi:hypothetical protein
VKEGEAKGKRATDGSRGKVMMMMMMMVVVMENEGKKKKRPPRPLLFSTFRETSSFRVLGGVRSQV